MKKKNSIIAGENAMMIIEKIGREAMWGNLAMALGKAWLEARPARNSRGRVTNNVDRNPIVAYSGLKDVFGKGVLATLTYHPINNMIIGGFRHNEWRIDEENVYLKDIPQALEMSLPSMGIKALIDMPHLQNREILEVIRRPKTPMKIRVKLDPTQITILHTKG